MNKPSQTSNRSVCAESASSGFDEFDDELFDLDAPIRPDVQPEEQVYTSQLSFPDNFGIQNLQNASLFDSDVDSGLSFALPSIDPLSQLTDSVFDANSSPFSIIYRTQNPSQQIVKQNDENPEANEAQTENEMIHSHENASDECGDETATNSDGDSVVELQFLSCIPQSIINLYRIIRQKYSDYSFVHVIAGQMCHRTFPMDCFHSVKLGLMLSIISTHCREMTPISVIAIGRDSTTMSTLMNHFRVYAERFYTPIGDFKIPRPHRDGIFVEANSLLMATNGVCFIGDWSSCNASCSAFVKNVLDSGRIIVDAQANVECPLKCAVWSYWLCSGAKKPMDNVMMFSNLFGIPLVFEENQTDSLIDAMLTANSTDAAAAALANDANSELYIDADEMQTFFHFIGRRSARFSDEAEHLLRDYFMATRLNRATLLSPRSLAILRQMSECHAKLCLRDCVYRNDVVACIVLCETFIFQIHGIEKTNAPFLGPIQHIIDVELYMQAFEKWLNENLGVFGRRRYGISHEN